MSHNRSDKRDINKLQLAFFFYKIINMQCMPYFFSAMTTTQPKKSTATTTGKKRDVQTPVMSTDERFNHVDNSVAGSTEVSNVEDINVTEIKRDSAAHAAKRKKLARNEKLVGSDGFEAAEQKSKPTSGEAGADRKWKSSAEVPGVKSAFERVQTPPTVAEKLRDFGDSVVEEKRNGRAMSVRNGAAETGTGSSSVAKAADTKADILDAVDDDDDVAGSFAMFATAKSTSGSAKTVDEELPVAHATSRTDSYDRLSTGGVAIAMADSGYQTYDHDLAALDDRPTPQLVPDHPKQPPEVPSELEIQSSISEPDMADTVARYSASSDSEMSVELPSGASSSGADNKPTSLDWNQVSTESATQDQAAQDGGPPSGKVARRASQEDLEQIR